MPSQSAHTTFIMFPKIFFNIFSLVFLGGQASSRQDPRERACSGASFVDECWRLGPTHAFVPHLQYEVKTDVQTKARTAPSFAMGKAKRFSAAKEGPPGPG